MTDSPRYRTIVTLKEIGYINEYPKNKDKFIWGLPSKYEDFKDREISAFCTCWICDYTKKSFEAAYYLDEIMCGEPYNFVYNRGFDFFIMDVDQEETLYGIIKMADVYKMFDRLHQLIRKYKSIQNAFICNPKATPYEETLFTLSQFKEFNGRTIDSQGRINLFLFMMTHCYEDYNYDSSILLPPLFENRILPNCRALSLIDKKTKKKDILPRVTSMLQWFSKKNPMTYWIGLADYFDFVKENPKVARKFSSMRLIRHPYRKR